MGRCAVVHYLEIHSLTIEDKMRKHVWYLPMLYVPKGKPTVKQEIRWWHNTCTYLHQCLSKLYLDVTIKIKLRPLIWKCRCAQVGSWTRGHRLSWCSTTTCPVPSAHPETQFYTKLHWQSNQLHSQYVKTWSKVQWKVFSTEIRYAEVTLNHS